MKIVYIHQYYNTPEMPGSTRSYEMARRWVGQGHELHVVTTSRTGEPGPAWVTNISGGANIHWRRISYSNAMRFSARIVAFLKFVCAAGPRVRSLKPDVIFVSSTPLTVILPALFAAAFRRTPIVLEVRDLWPTMPVATGDLCNPLLKMMALGLERLAYSRSRYIVALSPEMATGIASVAVSTKKIVVAPNSCDLELFEVHESRGVAFRQKFDWLGDRPFVVYCGTIGKLNDLGYLVKLAGCMRYIDPEVVFGICGGGKEETKIREESSANGTLNTNLFILGEVPKREVPDLLSAATVVTSVFLPLPEMRANSANKFFDGLAACKPVAINYGGWQAELLLESGAGIVMHESEVDQAAGQLAVFVRDKRRLTQAGAAARKLAHRSYSRDAISDVVLSAVVNARGQT